MLWVFEQKGVYFFEGVEFSLKANPIDFGEATLTDVLLLGLPLRYHLAVDAYIIINLLN